MCNVPMFHTRVLLSGSIERLADAMTGDTFSIFKIGPLHTAVIHNIYTVYTNTTEVASIYSCTHNTNATEVGMTS